MTFILILLGILVLVGVLFAVALWYAIIFTLMALAFMAGIVFFIAYSIAVSISGDPGTGTVAGIFFALLAIGALLFAYSKNSK